MIEDDLRDIIADAIPGIAVYSRQIPMDLPECVCVQEIGGSYVKGGIRRAAQRITVMAVSTCKATAENRLREARDALITCIPATVGGTHYYTAKSLADGSVKKKAARGPAYIEYVDMEVVASL